MKLYSSLIHTFNIKFDNSCMVDSAIDFWGNGMNKNAQSTRSSRNQVKATMYYIINK